MLVSKKEREKKMTQKEEEVNEYEVYALTKYNTKISLNVTAQNQVSAITTFLKLFADTHSVINYTICCTFIKKTEITKQKKQ